MEEFLQEEETTMTKDELQGILKNSQYNNPNGSSGPQ